MAWTEWHGAGRVRYWTDSGVEFTDGDTVLDRTTNLITRDHLRGYTVNNNVVAPSARGLVFDQFNFDTTGAKSLAVEIVAERMARIVDYTVQIVAGNQLLGNNVADQDMSRVKVYEGSLSEYWRTKGLASDFGILLDFAPRPDMPSSNPLIIRTVRVRLEV
jgi:hypothetical protein